MSQTLIGDLEILSRLPGAPGFEEPVRDYIAGVLSGLGVEHAADRIGNLICRVGGTESGGAERALHFDAHTDEPAFMVRRIDPRGLIYVVPIGYFVFETVVGQRVRIVTDFKGEKEVPGSFCVASFHGGAGGTKSVEDLWIDVGAASGDEVRAMGVKPGNSVVFDAPFALLGGGKRAMGKAFDDRAACAVLLEALRSLVSSPPPVDVLFSFSTQEEFLLRGAQTVFNSMKSVYGVVPKVSVSLDIGTCGTVVPGASPIETGKGPGIKLRDKSGVSAFSHVTNPRLVALMEDIACREGIPFQYDFLSGCTNADVFAYQECGVYAGGLGFATRNTHSPVEIVDIGDLLNTAAFVVALARNAAAFDVLP